MAAGNYELITAVADLARHITRIVDSGQPFGFDIETGYSGAEEREKASLKPEVALLAGISFADGAANWAGYVPLGHDLAENVDNAAAARLFWRLLATGQGVAHNALFELRHLARWFRDELADDPEYGEAVRAANGYFPVLACTQVEAYLAAEFQSFGLKFLVDKLFGHKMAELHELFPGTVKRRHKALRFNVLELTPAVVAYACEDALWCLRIHEHYWPQVHDQFLFKVEMRVLSVIVEMADEGILYDWHVLRRAKDELEAFRDRYNAEIMADLSEAAGQTVVANLASPAQVSDVLYDKLGLRTTVYTLKTRDLPPDERKMSTGKIALANLAKKHPVVAKILKWKEQTKLISSYLTKYEREYCGPDGRAHPNLIPHVVITGRFACSDPNYQQSPKKYHFDLEAAVAVHRAHADAHGPRCSCTEPEFTPPPGSCFTFNFRDVLVAPPEHYILGFDLSQAELRAIAGEAREEALLRAFADGVDVHELTASLMQRIPIDQVTPELRSVGKTFNFALLYGMGVKSLADRLAIPQEEAQMLYDAYFAAYPGIAAWGQKQVQLGKTQGYVTSRFGRKLPIWEYQSHERWVYQKGDRACVNYPIQGAATGDLLKMIMVRVRSAIRGAGLQDKVRLVMNVHDALEFYVHRTVKPQDLVALLEPAVLIDVSGWPAMRADWHIGKRWGSPREITVTPEGFFIGGEKVQESAPEVEHDEETGEDVVLFGEEEAAAVANLLTEASLIQVTHQLQVDREGRHVIVILEAMPDEAAYRRFRSFLDTRPGHNSLTLRTPEGDLDLDVVTNLGPDDVATVSLMLGPVSIVVDSVDVDFGQITAGLNLDL